jgi:Putative zinc-finger
VRCEAAERALSERLDDVLDRRRGSDLEAHLGTCPRCRAFERRARRVRELARLRPAAPVPDLVPAIMDRVRREAPTPLRPPLPEWTRYAAAFAAGVVVAALIVAGLPGARRGVPPALATEIPQRIAEASGEVTSYRATFRVLERGFHHRVPRRTFQADVAFRAPERFAARLTDYTAYPGPGWPANDVTLAVDGSRWRLDAPRGCPIEALPGCAPEGRDVIRVTGRPPFDGETPLPTDIVLPVRMLAGSDRVAVRGETAVLGHDAVVVELAYHDASPLFGFLQAGGLWRPFFPHDRVLVSLDRETWFPLAFEVRAAGGLDRARWAAGLGLAEEPAGRTLFRAQAVRLETGPDEVWRPAVGGPGSRDLGFRDAVAEDLDALMPTELRGLRPHRAGTFAGQDEVLLSYVRGLSWLVIRETTEWRGPGLFGDLGDLVRALRLPGGGVAYYEPAEDALGRRLAIHADGWDVALETNLPLADLVAVAASLPIEGRRAAAGWLDQIPVDRAVAEAPFALLPGELPADYRPWAARRDGHDAVTVWFRRPGAEPGPGIVLHQAAGVGLPPPLEGEVLAVRVRGAVGRYSPSRGLLEWVEGNVYRSLGGGALDLPGLLSVAGSLEPAG